MLRRAVHVSEMPSPVGERPQPVTLTRYRRGAMPSTSSETFYDLAIRSIEEQEREVGIGDGAVRILPLSRYEDEVFDSCLPRGLHQVPVAFEVDRFHCVVTAPAGGVGGPDPG